MMRKFDNSNSPQQISNKQEVMDTYSCGTSINTTTTKAKKSGGHYNARKWYLYVNYNFRIPAF